MTKFKFTIAAKIFSILAVIALFAFIMGIYSFISTKSAGKIAADISNVYVTLFDYNSTLNHQVEENRRLFRRYVVTPTEEFYNAMIDSKDKTYDTLNKIDNLLTDKYIASLIPEVATVFPEYKGALTTYLDTTINQVNVRNNIVPKEQLLIKLALDFLNTTEELRGNIATVIRNNTDDPATAMRYFINYSRTADIAVDTRLALEIFATARYTSDLKELEKMGQLMQKVFGNLNGIKEQIVNRASLQTVDKAIELLGENEKVFKEIIKAYEERASLNSKRDGAVDIFTNISQQISNSINTIIEDRAHYAETSLKAVNYVIVAILLIMTAIIAAASFITYISIIKPLRSFVATAKDLTSGDRDLTIRLQTKSHDEISDLAKYFNTFIANVQEIVNEVKNSTNEVASGNSQLAATIEELSATFNSQTEQVNSIVVDMNNITNQSQDATNELNSALQIINTTTESTTNGQNSLTEVKNTMLDINTKTTHYLTPLTTF